MTFSASSETGRQGPRSVAALVAQLQSGELRQPGIGPVGTGFEPLDTVLDGGFLPGDVILLGGQPGAGKTLCALQWARHMARSGRRVTFACFEHDETALLQRLLVQELAVVAAEGDPSERIRARAIIRDLTLGIVDLRTAVSMSPLIDLALRSMEVYAPYLQLLRASSQLTTPQELDSVCGERLGTGDALIVDYLQKVPIHAAVDVSDRIYRAIELMKELAIAHQISVVTLAAASNLGIDAERIRLRHLRGSDALAHESDVAIVMNHKVTATSERHTKFDLTQLDDARTKTIFSIEKNRRGEVDIHLEFVKDFANFRFKPRGGFVSEALKDE